MEGSHGEGNSFGDEQDGDIVANRVEDFAILPDEAASDFSGDRLALAILQVAGFDLLIQLVDQGLFGEVEVLVSFGTAEELEKVWIEG